MPFTWAFSHFYSDSKIVSDSWKISVKLYKNNCLEFYFTADRIRGEWFLPSRLLGNRNTKKVIETLWQNLNMPITTLIHEYFYWKCLFVFFKLSSDFHWSYSILSSSEDPVNHLCFLNQALYEKSDQNC